MLTRRALGVAIIAISLLIGSAPHASADTGGVTCPPDQPLCIVVVTGPGSPGTGGTGPTDPPGTPRMQGARALEP